MGKHIYAHLSKDDLTYFSKLACPKAFKNDWMDISPGYSLDNPEAKSKLFVKSNYAYDGYSIVPDLRSQEPAILHDAIYQYCEAIAKEWNWTVKQVLKWADEVFLEAMLFYSIKPWQAYLYYRGVRLVGYKYHKLAKKYRDLKHSLGTIISCNIINNGDQ